MSATESIHLGFGCFHFTLGKQTPGPISGGKYLEEVRLALERLPGAALVSVYADDEFAQERIPLSSETQAFPPLSRGGYPIPNIGFSEILVVLEIPPDLQGELLEPIGSSADPLSGDRFLVCLRHGWTMPQAMIWAIDADAGYSGSEGVKLTREYLQAFMGSGLEAIGFESLGPSPAHVDVVLNPRSPIASDPASDFLLQSHTRPSYHHYELAYDPSVFAEPEEAALSFLDEASSPLDLYYRCEAARAREIFEWGELLNRVESIKSAFQEPGVRGALRRLGRQRGPINSAAIALADLELEQLLSRQELGKDLNSCYGPGRPEHLRQLTAASVAEFSPYPTEQITRLLTLFEQQRLLGRDLLVAGLVALLAATVGAVATILASA